jgi:hypothetical protein
MQLPYTVSAGELKEFPQSAASRRDPGAASKLLPIKAHLWHQSGRQELETRKLSYESI